MLLLVRRKKKNICILNRQTESWYDKVISMSKEGEIIIGVGNKHVVVGIKALKLIVKCTCCVVFRKMKKKC